MEWLRWYHGAVSDPKWPLIARKAGVSVGAVVSVWAALLEHASQDEERGSVADFDSETIDALYGYEDGTCAAVYEAMSDKGIIAGGCICAWRKRQPLREDATATERKRQQRSREKDDESRHVTPCHAHVTHGSHDVTTEQRREEKNKNINTPPLPPLGGDCASASPAAEKPKSKPQRQQASRREPAQREPSRREPTGNSLPELKAAIEAFTPDDGLRHVLGEFRVMRERIRKPMTGKALELILAKLRELAGGDTGSMVRIVEQSIANSWQGVFAIKENFQSRASPGPCPGSVPFEQSAAYPQDDTPYPTYEEIRAKWLERQYGKAGTSQ